MLSIIRYKNFILLAFAILVSTLAVYWLCYVPERTSVMAPVTQEEIKKELIFNELLNFILNPTTLCTSPVTLGGVWQWKNIINLRNDLDGDKIICLDPGPGIHEGCVVLSFGIGDDWSFEEKIQERFKCKVFAFDPSINKRNHLHSEGIWFFDRGLGNVDTTFRYPDGHKWNISTFGSVVDMMGLRDCSIDVVKIDIEGWELPALMDILQKGHFNKVNHLCVEFHFNHVKDWRTTLKMLRAITQEAGLGLFSTRKNPLIPPLQVPGIPHRKEHLLYEMAWVRIDQLQNSATAPIK